MDEEGGRKYLPFAITSFLNNLAFAANYDLRENRRLANRLLCKLIHDF